MSWLGKHIRNRLVAGVVVAVPVAITYLVLSWLFRFADGLLGPGIDWVTGRHIPGVGIAGGLVLVYLIGLLGTNVLGRWMIHVGDSALHRAPVVNIIYKAAKQVMIAIRMSRETPFQRVVLVEFPRQGIWSLGFATGSAVDVSGKRMLPVFIATAPNPTSGYLILFPEAEVRPTTMTTDEALRMVISGGFASPTTICSSESNSKGG
jgi:uncharacterized membrane protein